MILTPDHSGYVTIIGRNTTEIDTYSCVHCNRVRYFRSSDPKITADPGGTCRKCMARICSFCMAQDCMNFEAKLDLYERRQDLFKALGLEL